MREYLALKRQWAKAQAQTYNLNAVTEGVPYLLEDFMGSGNREARIAAHKAKKFKDEIDVQHEKLRLFKIKQGKTPIDEGAVPLWARGKAKK